MMTARQRYLERRGVAGPWTVDGEGGDHFTAAVVIPACDEEEWLFHTLTSLAGNPIKELRQTLVLVVINHAVEAAETVRAANLRTLKRLQSEPHPPELRLAWIDAASRGRELPTGGAGAARRLGLDRTLERLTVCEDPILICLDADTLVDSNYLQAIQHHFSISRAGGAVLPFSHQAAATPGLQAAIDRYELFLRSYRLGLQLAGSPYAFHTIGSAMACRASAYVQADGMPQRPAGEDFYFLQHLAKTSGVAQVHGACVYPSARISNRVPFGTGPTLDRLAGDPQDLLFYPDEAFLLLGQFLQLATGEPISGAELQRRINRLQPQAGTFFCDQKLAVVIDRLRRNSRGEEGFNRAFHAWFDGLKTLRLLRAICNGSPFFMQTAEEAVPPLLSRAGLTSDRNLPTMLETLKIRQNEG